MIALFCCKLRELAEVVSQNLSLQNMNERLRGADVTDLEREMTTELDIIRAQVTLYLLYAWIFLEIVYCI